MWAVGLLLSLGRWIAFVFMMQSTFINFHSNLTLLAGGDGRGPLSVSVIDVVTIMFIGRKQKKFTCKWLFFVFNIANSESFSFL